jgi:hypothetical protein
MTPAPRPGRSAILRAPETAAPRCVRLRPDEDDDVSVVDGGGFIESRNVLGTSTTAAPTGRGTAVAKTATTPPQFSLRGALDRRLMRRDRTG